MSLGFLGKNLRPHNLAWARRLVLACTNRYLETLIFVFDCFASAFTCLFSLASFPCFYASRVSISYV